MLYLGTSPVPDVADLLDRRKIGLMCAPTGANPRPGWLWAMDNGCFTKAWDEAKWLAYIERPWPRAGCLFATVPDVVADAEATRERFDKYAGTVVEARYPVAYVGQDGLTMDTVPPWSELDCLFIGGSTEWKMSEDAFDFAAEARERGKWVHVGRVNSQSRYRAWAAHADSCDGTFLAFGPDTNLPRLTRWLDNHDRAPQLRYERSEKALDDANVDEMRRQYDERGAEVPE